MQKKTINKNIENISNRKLSIQFSLDGFSFCIQNGIGEKYHFTKYIFDKILSSPNQLLTKIETIFREEKNLQDHFSEVHVIHENTYNTIVPNEYFSEKEIKNYLKFSVKTLSTDFVAYDDTSIEMKNIFIPYMNINNFLFQNFGKFEYNHHATVLIEKLNKIKRSQEISFYCNVNSSFIDIVVFDGHGSFIFYNSFIIDTKEDFIYYILFVFEQLKLDVEKVTLRLGGEINKSSELYKVAYKYIRNIEFIVRKNSLLKDSMEFEEHSNIVIL